jgi:hypothetical protein
MATLHHSRTFISYGPKKVDERLIDFARQWAIDRKVLRKDDRDGIKAIGPEDTLDELDQALIKEASTLGIKLPTCLVAGQIVAKEEKAKAMAAKKAAAAAKKAAAAAGKDAAPAAKPAPAKK